MRHRSVNRATQNRGAVVLVNDEILQPKKHLIPFSYDCASPLSPQFNVEMRDSTKKDQTSKATAVWTAGGPKALSTLKWG